ncbi:carbonic anhydrase family protein [Paucibacter sp. Y2R2-4]|uniref:carbonic anhydrase family protein n=1 Tax=Paucibacter sp. Y2R2-4 TaxID=2893553 RepID=UPI0021E4B122|nr:carbonic anhydrase family protein [Paucibacter sp. Y2R2-4]MCV2349146.1 carbonic anhydrase [Paucibacter sp. Y2R2-4]
MTVISKSFALIIALGLGSAQASDDHGGPVTPKPYTPGVTLSKSVQASITPEQAIKILQAGNQRFATGRSLKYDHKRHVRQTALGQFPFASVVACIDSRSAPEQVFDTGVGDIFTTRVAGATVNEDMVGSLEYAAKVAGSRAIIVLGHTNCGAIKGACDDVQMGNLTGLLAKLKPAVEASSTPGERNSKNYSFVKDVTEMNVKLTVEKIRNTSPILKEMEAAGQIKIVGAVYDTGTGQVHWQ